MYFTHVVKVKAEFDDKQWNPSSLRELVEEKIKKINDFWRPHDKRESILELFSVKDRGLEVWVLLAAIAELDTILEQSGKWVEKNLTESGITVKKVGVMTTTDMLRGEKFTEKWIKTFN